MCIKCVTSGEMTIEEYSSERKAALELLENPIALAIFAATRMIPPGEVKQQILEHYPDVQTRTVKVPAGQDPAEAISQAIKEMTAEMKPKMGSKPSFEDLEKAIALLEGYNFNKASDTVYIVLDLLRSHRRALLEGVPAK